MSSNVTDFRVSRRATLRDGLLALVFVTGVLTDGWVRAAVIVLGLPMMRVALGSRGPRPPLAFDGVFVLGLVSVLLPQLFEVPQGLREWLEVVTIGTMTFLFGSALFSFGRGVSASAGQVTSIRAELDTLKQRSADADR